MSGRRRSDWLAGVVVGAVAGLLLAEWPTAGLLIAVTFTLPSALLRRGTAIVGLLVGLPAVWLAVIAMAAERCAAFDAQPGQGCVMADATAWVVLAAGALVAGVTLSVVAAVRR